MLLLSDRCLGI